jgi:vacuolar protein-sorting-associated protein 4
VGSAGGGPGGGSAVAGKPAGAGAGSKDDESAKLKAGLASAIVAEKPNVKWSDIAGLEGAKEALREAVILPVRFPNLFVGDLKPWRGIMLYGPPGTGKSYLAKAVATEADSTFLAVSASDLTSKWQGEGEKQIKALFELARDRRPSIIFVDEIDSLCRERGAGGSENEASRRMVTEILVQMQGVGKDNDGVLVLAATNTPWEIDAAIRRRFEKRVYIPLPEAPARTTMFQLSMRNTPNSLTEENFARLGERTEGLSGADIATAVKDVMFEPVRKCKNARYFEVLPAAAPGGPPRYRPVVEDPPCTLCPPDLPSVRPPRAQPGEPCAQCGRVRLDMMNIPSGEQLVRPGVEMADFERLLGSRMKRTVAQRELERFETWTKEFGVEGS